MLKQILLKNFKSYRDQALPLAPLTLMIGANASGKSNAIEAFRFLSWLAGGQKLSAIQHQVDDSDQLFRGSVFDLKNWEEECITLGCVLDQDMIDISPHSKYQLIKRALIIREARQRHPDLFKEALKSKNLNWDTLKITLREHDGNLYISQEGITLHKDENIALYEIIESNSPSVAVRYNNFSQGNKDLAYVVCSDQLAILCQLMSPATFGREYERASWEIPETVETFQYILENVLFLDLIPALMRGDHFPEKKLRSNGSNLTGVLYQLWQEQEEDNRTSILKFIQSLPEQDVKDLQFFEDRRGRISMELVESFGGKDKAWSVELLSDGTLRVLAIAAAVLSAPEGSTVVIEEIDNGVHPSRANHLLSTMQEHAKRRNIRLLLTTHNPALMDALPDEALGDVVFCYRDPQEGDSRLVRLSDLEDYAGLVMQGSLGDLVTRGIVDRFVKSPITPEAKKQNALDWLERLQGTAA